MTIIPQNATQASEEDPLFTSLHLDNFIPAELALAVLMALARNRIKGHYFRPQTIPQLVREVRHRLAQDPIMAEIAACYERQPRGFLLLLYCQISAWAHIFGLAVSALCQALEEDEHRPLRNALGQRRRCWPQRISELHARIGPELKQRFYARFKDILIEALELTTLSEGDLERAIAHQTFDFSLLAIADAYGFSYFLNYVYWQGLFAAIEAALTKEVKPNAYSTRELMASYLQRLDGGVRTPSALSDELRNDLWAHDGQGRAIIAPLGRTFVERLRLVDPDKLIIFKKRLVRRALRPHLLLRGRRYRPIVAIDATLLLLRGDFEGKGKFWDHVAKRAIWGYKLYVIIAVESRLPLGFILRTVEEGQDDPQSEAQFLDQLLAQARELLGVDRLGFILFDKGFWNSDEFAKLDDEGEQLITAAILYKSVKKAIAAIPRRDWIRAQRNERCADTSLTLANGCTLRLIIWKKLGRVVVRNKNGNPKRDKRGRILTKPGPVHYCYLTNLSADEWDPDQVIALYGKRWGVEDFIEEIKNQYHLGRFPGKDLQLVKVHLILTLILYILMKQFKQLAAQWLARAEYARMELCRFSRQFLQAPKALLERLKAAPKNHGPRRRQRRDQGLLKSLLAFGLSPP